MHEPLKVDDKKIILDELENLLKSELSILSPNLASNQESNRKNEIEEELQLLDMLRDSVKSLAQKKIKNVEIGSFVELVNQNHKNWYFLSPLKGGNVVSVKGHSVLILSVFSLLGSQILDLKKGARIEVLVKDQKRSYKIESLF